MTKVDMIMPTYNRAEFLQAAIGSVLNQSFRDFTLLVVDDASKDDTQSVVKAFDDKRIKYIRHTVNRGEGVAKEYRDAEFVAFLNDDDDK